jgi:hypothetical protein
MPQENKRAIRERMKALKGKSTPELKELYAGEITATDKTAIEKVLRQRGALIPEKSGPVVAAPGEQRIITLGELASAETTKDKRTLGLGWLEGSCFALGILIAVLLWPRNSWIAILYGVGCSVIIYAVLHYCKRAWIDMGRE